MHSIASTITRSLLLTVALAGPACRLAPEFIGGTFTTTTTTSETNDSSGAEPGASTTTSVEPTTGSEPGTSTTAVEGTSTSAGPESGAYGSFCEVVGFGPDLQSTQIAPQPSCDGGICLLVSDAGPLACFGDPECDEEAAGSVCAENGLCNLSPAFLEKNARCTQTCEMVDDCPEIPGCVTGISCTAIITLIGELCCQKVCACKDYLLPFVAENVQENCDNNPQLCR